MQVYLATFASTHAALSFEAAFKPEGALVPVPPKLRAGCGMALRFTCESDSEATKRCEQKAVEAGLGEDDWELWVQESNSYRAV